LLVTSHDVARYAGVSQSTVSRALRGVAGVAPETVRRVQEAAAALSYVPNEAGRTLSTRLTRTVGVVAAELTNPFYPELIEPIRLRLDEAGYRTLLVPDSVDAPIDAERLMDGTIDGVIVLNAPEDSTLPAALDRRGIPYVLANRTVKGAAGDACVVDNEGGAGLVADLLVEEGHRSIGAVMGPSTTSTGRERERGFMSALERHGLALDPSLVGRGAYSHEAGFDAGRAILRSHRPTAIFCGNDLMAMGAFDAAVSLQLVPGHDLAIVGFDDIAMARWEVFGLTTVRIDLPAVATHAVELLLSRLADPSLPQRTVQVTPTLVLRRSHHVDRSLLG